MRLYKSIMRILTICDHNGVSEFYRTLTPYRLLAEAGEIEMEQDSGQNPALIDHLDHYDALVFSRPDSAEHALIISEARRRGIKVVVDVDDNLLLLPPSIGAYDAWHVRGTGQITARLWYFKHCIRQADVLTVSTAALGRQLCEGEPHRLRADYLVLRNCVLGGEWEALTPGQALTPGPSPRGGGEFEKRQGEVWIGWWGIYNHWDDWREIAPYIEPVIAQWPRARLVLLGMPELAQLFPRLRKSGQLIVGPFVSPGDLGGYRRLVAQFDVALAPTAACPFNESKSDLKVLQYGAAGVPVIASGVTYGEWRGFATVLSDPAGWGEALDWALDNPVVMRRDGQRLRAQVLATRTYEANFREWLGALQ